MLGLDSLLEMISGVKMVCNLQQPTGMHEHMYTQTHKLMHAHRHIHMPPTHIQMHTQHVHAHTTCVTHTRAHIDASNANTVFHLHSTHFVVHV